MLRPGISEDLDPELIVGKLIECGWIDEQDNGLYLHDWGEWRSYYNKYVRDRKSNSERQARFKERHRDSDNVSDNVTTEKALPEEKPEKYGKEFEEFWAFYPRKADKGACFKKYKARIKDGYSPDELLTAAKNYKAQCDRDHTDQKYIKHGKTFLGESLPFTEYIPGHGMTEAPQQNQSIPDGVNPFR